jgi:hypothetical protein
MKGRETISHLVCVPPCIMPDFVQDSGLAFEHSNSLLLAIDLHRFTIEVKVTKVVKMIET